MQCARRQGGKLGGIEPRHAAGKFSEIERGREFVQGFRPDAAPPKIRQNRRRGDRERSDSDSRRLPIDSEPDRFESASPLTDAKRL